MKSLKIMFIFPVATYSSNNLCSVFWKCTLQKWHWKSPNSINVIGALGLPRIGDPCFKKTSSEIWTGLMVSFVSIDWLSFSLNPFKEKSTRARKIAPIPAPIPIDGPSNFFFSFSFFLDSFFHLSHNFFH